MLTTSELFSLVKKSYPEATIELSDDTAYDDEITVSEGVRVLAGKKVMYVVWTLENGNPSDVAWITMKHHAKEEGYVANVLAKCKQGVKAVKQVKDGAKTSEQVHAAIVASMNR